MPLFLPTVCHFICGVAPERHAESLGLSKWRKKAGGERDEEEEGARKQMKQGRLSPEGLKQNREAEDCVSCSSMESKGQVGSRGESFHGLKAPADDGVGWSSGFVHVGSYRTR